MSNKIFINELYTNILENKNYKVLSINKQKGIVIFENENGEKKEETKSWFKRKYVKADIWVRARR
jgi:hypothetical protein